MKNQMSAAAWRHGLRNASLGLGVSFAVFGGLVWAVTQISGRPWMESSVLVFCMTMPLVLVGIVAIWIRDRRFAGLILIDCGPVPMRSLHVFNALTTLALSFSFVTSQGELLGPGFKMFSLLAWLSGAALEGLIAFDRVQMREKGIWCSLNLVKWEQIRAYHWEGSELVFQAETFFSKILRSDLNRLKISEEHREGVDEILQERASYFAS